MRLRKLKKCILKSGKVKKFYLYCSGLPAPECANNPLGFKFSWSPRGALLSQMNSAHYLFEGKEVYISDKDLMGIAKPYHVLDGYNFVAYPNRISIPFRDFYGIPEAETVIRGSLRYEGNPALVKALMDLGWLNAEHKGWLTPGMTWAQITQEAIGAVGIDEISLIATVKERCNYSNEAQSDRMLDGLSWIW